jgi:hypothetical protein
MVGLSVLAFERNSGALAEFRINLDLLALRRLVFVPETSLRRCALDHFINT